jgi:hypothetical protein
MISLLHDLPFDGKDVSNSDWQVGATCDIQLRNARDRCLRESRRFSIERHQSADLKEN